MHPGKPENDPATMAREVEGNSCDCKNFAGRKAGFRVFVARQRAIIRAQRCQGATPLDPAKKRRLTVECIERMDKLSRAMQKTLYRARQTGTAG